MLQLAPLLPPNFESLLSLLQPVIASRREMKEEQDPAPFSSPSIAFFQRANGHNLKRAVVVEEGLEGVVH